MSTHIKISRSSIFQGCIYSTEELAEKPSVESERGSAESNQTVKSIFDLRKDENSSKSVSLPQILTVFASRADKNFVEKEAKNCVLPSIAKNRSKTNSLQESVNTEITQNIAKKTPKGGLFDFRAQAVQQKARARQIQRLQRRGYNVAPQSVRDSRFVSHPYEGSVDDIRLIKKQATRSPKSKNKKGDSIPNCDFSKQKVEFSPPADEETIAKSKLPSPSGSYESKKKTVKKLIE